MLVEEYNVAFVQIKGIDNVVADGLSCLDADYDSDIVLPEITQDEQGIFSAYCMANLEGWMMKNNHSTINQMSMT
jgi:hypothetical protein